MPIDISSSVNNISKQVFGTSIINKYLGSTIFVGIIITFILLLIIMIFYPAKENTSVKIIFKVGLYSFLSSLLILFLHDGIIKSNLSNDKISENNEKIIQNLTNKNRDSIYNNNIPIKPNITGGNGEDDDDDYLEDDKKNLDFTKTYNNNSNNNHNINNHNINNHNINNHNINNNNNSNNHSNNKEINDKPPVINENRFKK
jgi:hypothetical protein